MIKLFQIKLKSNCPTSRQTRRNNQATDDDPSLPKTYCLHYWTRQDNHCCQPRILAKLWKIIVVQSGYDQYIAKQWENIIVPNNHCCPHRLFAKTVETTTLRIHCCRLRRINISKTVGKPIFSTLADNYGRPCGVLRLIRIIVFVFCRRCYTDRDYDDCDDDSDD